MIAIDKKEHTIYFFQTVISHIMIIIFAWDLQLMFLLTLTTHATTDVGEDAKKEDLFGTAGGNANWCSHSGKQYGGSSKKLTIELPYDPASALLGIYPGDTGVLF